MPLIFLVICFSWTTIGHLHYPHGNFRDAKSKLKALVDKFFHFHVCQDDNLFEKSYNVKNVKKCIPKPFNKKIITQLLNNNVFSRQERRNRFSKYLVDDISSTMHKTEKWGGWKERETFQTALSVFSQHHSIFKIKQSATTFTVYWVPFHFFLSLPKGYLWHTYSHKCTRSKQIFRITKCPSYKKAAQHNVH